LLGRALDRAIARSIRRVIFLGGGRAAAHPRGIGGVAPDVMLRSLLSYLCIAVAASGCAQMSYGSPQIHDSVIRTRQAIKPGSAVKGGLEQTGTTIQISGTRTCEIVEERDIVRTTRQERENPVLAPELVLLAVGSVPAGLGIGYLADAGSVYPSDRNARLYNSSGPEGATAAGLVLLGWGVVMMAVPVVDLARSVGSKEEETNVTEQGMILQRDVPCEGSMQPAAFRPVTGRVPGDAVTLGQTDGTGRFKADLVQVVPSRIFESSNPPTSMEVLIDNSIIGKVSLDTVDKTQTEDRRRRDEEAWRAADVTACRYAKDERQCDSVRAYTVQFPNGEHIQEARRLLDPSSRVTQVQIAASPEDLAKAEAARKAAADTLEAATKAAADACRKKCEAACKKDAACKESCIEEVCP
jgi:hypothetical protein